MQTGIGYLRRSKKSDDRTVSLEEQERKIIEYAASQNLKLAALIRHDGISGTKRKRFDEIKKAIREHKANVLLVYHRDRLARDVSGLLDLLRACHTANVSVREVTTGRDLRVNRSGEFLETGVAALFDEYFPRLIGEKTADALRHLKSQGRRYSNLPPFGFKYVNNELVSEPEEQRALAIIRECAKLGISINRTIGRVRSAQYLGRLSRPTVHKYLSAPLGPPG